MSYHVPDFIDTRPFNLRQGLRLLRLAWFDREAFDQTINPLRENSAITLRLAIQVLIPILICTIFVYALIFAIALVVNQSIPISLRSLAFHAGAILFLYLLPFLFGRFNRKTTSPVSMMAGMLYVAMTNGIILLMTILLLLWFKSKLHITPWAKFRFSTIYINVCFLPALWMFNYDPYSRKATRWTSRGALWLSGLLTFSFYSFTALSMIMQSSLVAPDTNLRWDNMSIWIMMVGAIVSVWFTINLANRHKFTSNDTI